MRQVVLYIDLSQAIVNRKILSEKHLMLVRPELL